jgi:pimeloyl-ACP methyl ester carboxylesterase
MSPTEDQPESRAASGSFRDVTEGIWKLREAGPPDAERTVLLLAGALASARCYDALVGHSTVTAGSVRLVAATLPGFGHTPAPDDVTVENYGRLAVDLAASLGADAVAGHSLGANVALEMALRGGFSGPFVLLSPSFCRRDESIFPRALDRLGSVLGHLPFSLMFRIIGPAMRGSLPPDQADDVVAELGNNDPRFVRRQTRAYLHYLDGHSTLASDLATSGRSATVIFGEKDDIKIKPEERAALEGSPQRVLSSFLEPATSLSSRSRGRSPNSSSRRSAPAITRPTRSSSQHQPVSRSTSCRCGVGTCSAGRWNSAPEGLWARTTART